MLQNELREEDWGACPTAPLGATATGTFPFPVKLSGGFPE
jgi:hypothetical protein